MQRAELEQRQAAIKTQFEDMTKQKEAINGDLYRLQGMYDLLGDLITNYQEEPTNGAKPKRTKEPVRQS